MVEKCLECGEEFEGKTRLSLHHFRVHGLTAIQYTIKYFYNGVRPLCPVCGEETRYENGKNIFKEFCPKHKSQAQAKWGKENGFGAKIDAGWKKGLTKEDHPGILSQSQKISGEGNHFYQKNFIKLTGCEEEIRKDISEKNKRTEEQYFQAFKVRDLFEPITPYSGYKNQTQELEVKCKTCGQISRENLFSIINHAVCKNCWDPPKHTEATKRKLRERFLLSREQFEQIINKRQEEFQILYTYEQYFDNGRKRISYFPVICKKCGRTLDRKLSTLEAGTLCQYCYSPSKDEKEISDFIESLGLEIIKNSRQILPPYEVDVFVPSRSIAIEYNGLFWHSEIYKDNSYHHNKYLLSKENDIKLVQIFSDEWEQKQEIVKSMLRARLGLIKDSIFARDCSVWQTEKKEYSPTEKEEVIGFFEENHVDGNTNFVNCFYLRDPNMQIVAALSIRRPFHSSHGNAIEIARFATKRNFHIPGGFSRLFKQVKKWASPVYSKVITYSDLRYGDGLVYENNGFSLKSTNPINYWFTDYKKRYNRFKYRAKDGKTEKEIAEQAGVVKIYGAGNKLYEILL